MLPRALLTTLVLAAPAVGQGLDLSALPVYDAPPLQAAERDWLVDGVDARAAAYRSADGRELVLDNGLVRRAFRMEPNAATVAFDNLMTGESILRAVRPEARVVLDGIEFDLGGLIGQPNHAYLDPAWLEEMSADPDAWRCVGYALGEPAERLAWKRVRHHAPGVAWPPKGVALRLDFAAPATDGVALLQRATASGAGRAIVFEGPIDPARDDWAFRSSEGGVIAGDATLSGPRNAAAFLERPVPADVRIVEATFATQGGGASWGPGIALVFADRTVKFNLRDSGSGYDAGNANFGVWDGAREDPSAGGRQDLDMSLPWTLRLRRDGAELHAEARQTGDSWRRITSVALAEDEHPTAVRVGKMDMSGGAEGYSDPGAPGRVRILGAGAYGAVDANGREAAAALSDKLGRITLSVHYELYDGVPLYAKWVTVTNASDEPVLVNDFTVDILAAVENSSRVETRGVREEPPHLRVESDYAMGGLSFMNSMRHAVHWKTDPEFLTQVNYLRTTPCLLEVGPENQAMRTVAPGESFDTIRSFVAPYDSEDGTRVALTDGRVYRTIAPWGTENPLMMHVRYADPETVHAAIDQCAEVGFEMVILTFGSGFNIEDGSDENLAKMRGYVEYAASKGIEIGSYSLLSSRRVKPDADNCINPLTGEPGGVGMIHGGTPSLASDWGQEYLATLKRFYDETGAMLLEHDGPYPGNLDDSTRLPLQHGLSDSRYVNWMLSAELYSWLRERGVYINAPDWYFLVGSNKCGMGYRETNWSLPRAQQVIHARQNIFDGLRYKLPSMGWMFVPLTQYHGGGAAATVEPLDEHLDHYELMLASNLGAGVQACYRGPRLYDTPRVRDAVKRWVDWFKEHRDILESPIVHDASRRADGRDLDWVLHANPELDEKGMLVVFNPTEADVERELLVDLYYTGLRGTARAIRADGSEEELTLKRQRKTRIHLRVPARGATWVSFR